MVTNNQKNTKTGSVRIFGTTKILVISALLIAMSIVLGKFLAFNIGDSLRISFENLSILMAGIFFGPSVGAFVGIGADIVGCLLKGYALNPIITVGAGCIGFLSGFIYRKLKTENKILKTAVSVGTAHLAGSVIIKSVGLFVYYHTAFQVLAMRLPIYIITSILESAVIAVLVRNRAFSAQLERMRKK